MLIDVAVKALEFFKKNCIGQYNWEALWRPIEKILQAEVVENYLGPPSNLVVGTEAEVNSLGEKLSNLYELVSARVSMDYNSPSAEAHIGSTLRAIQKSMTAGIEARTKYDHIMLISKPALCVEDCKGRLVFTLNSRFIRVRRANPLGTDSPIKEPKEGEDAPLRCFRPVVDPE